jgi:hypothetical protein
MTLIKSVAWVREWIIPTKQLPLVGEVSANFCEWRVSCGQHNWSLRPYARFSGPEPLLFLSSSSSIVLTSLGEPCSRPTTTQKIWWGREPNLHLWICSHKLWPLDHRGGPNLLMFYWSLFEGNYHWCLPEKCDSLWELHNIPAHNFK